MYGIKGVNIHVGEKNNYSGFDPLMKGGDSMTLLTIKRAYLKMTERSNIGWDELTDELANTLAQVMGDDEFVLWNESEDLKE